jgi:HPt (histidine-containing phosphotransfer) domain-containing protein
MRAAHSLDAMFKLLAMLPADARDAMVRMYCEALESQVGLLRQSLAQGHTQATMAAAHKIAGAAGMMQDQEVSRAARDIEAALRASGEEEALRHWPTMQACATSSLACLRRTYPAPA